MPADDEVRWDAVRLRARARQVARNNAYIRQYLNLVAANVVGPTGIGFEADVRNNDGKIARGINNKIEEAREEWSEGGVTRDGTLRWPRFSQLTVRTVARDGELFIRKWRGFSKNRFGFALEPIDADQVDPEYNIPRSRGQNEIRMGIEIDEDGRRVAYHAWDSPASPLGLVPDRKRERIPADQIIHLYDPDRVNQTRGVTWIAGVLAAAHMLDKYEETALVGARVGAAQSIVFSRKDGEVQGEGVAADEENKVAMDVEPGQGFFAPEGYEVSDFKPNYPTTEYGQFVKQELRRIATGLGVSYNALCNDLENVNFSSIRAGLLIERDLWRLQQHWVIGDYCQPIHNEWVAMARLTGALTLDARDYRQFRRAIWTPRGWAWVDPQKETRGSVEAIEHGLDSHIDVLGERGKNIERVFENLKRAKELAAEYGIDIAGPKTAAPNPTGTDDDEDEDDEEGGGKKGDQGRNLRGDVRGVGRLAATLGAPGHNDGGH